MKTPKLCPRISAFFRQSALSAAGIAALLMAAAPGQADDAQEVSARMDEDRIVVDVAGKEFTSYLFGEEHKYPFFYPVTGPMSGESVTAWDQEPYPHHSSLYISLDRVRSENVPHANYWQPRRQLETGQIQSRKPEIVSQEGGRVILRDQTDWVVPATGAHQLRDTRTVAIWAPSPKIRVMDFQFDIEAMKDLVVGQTGHSFFSARMRPELAVGCRERGADWADLGTGSLIDSLGGRNEKGTREKAAAWCAAYGTMGGHTEGLAIIQHSDNPMYPAKWFNRDYGFFSPTPFAFDGDIRIEKGRKMTFRYRVVVFVGNHEEAGIAAWHEDFESSPPTTLVPAGGAGATDGAGVMLRHDEEAKTVEIVVRGEPFTTYHYGDDRHVPFLWPVHGEGGVGMTRNYPMAPDEPSIEDHPHHCSLYLAYGAVNGYDFWHVGRGRPGTIRTAKVETGAGDGFAWIRAHNQWLANDSGKPVLKEIQELRFHDAPSSSRYFDFNTTFVASHGEVTFSDSKEGLLAFRIRPEIDGKNNGVLANAHGGRGESAVYAKPSPWMDFSGQVEGYGVRGIALLDHPDNALESQWHVRDYGLAAINPFGRHAVAGLEDGSHTIKAGDSLTLRYRFLVHSGDAIEADVAGHYELYVADDSARQPVH